MRLIHKEEPSPFEVVLVAEHEDVVVATGGLRVIPDHTLANCPSLDILVVPGGYGTREVMSGVPRKPFDPARQL